MRDSDRLRDADLLATPGRHIELGNFDPASTGNFKDKREAREKLCADIE